MKKTLTTNRQMYTWTMELTDSPHHSCKPVKGVGINDMAGATCYVDGKLQLHPAYQSWRHRLTNTYCPKHKQRHIQRYGEIAEEWVTLSGYYDWWLEQPYYADASIDSDLLSTARGLPKAYTPATAASVPEHLNKLLNAQGNARGGLPQGVSRSGKGYIARLNKADEGRWKSPVTRDLIEACDWYWKKKLPYALVTAYELLDGHPQRDDLMIGVKLTLQQQHEESMHMLYELTEQESNDE